MKKLIALISATMILTGLLASCGSSASYNLSDVVTALDAVIKVDNPKEIPEDDLIYEWGVTIDNVEEFVGKASNTNGEAGIIIAIKAKAGTADAVKTELEAARDGKAEALSSYPEFATCALLTKAGRVIIKGDYVVLAIGGDTAVAEKDGAEKAYEPIDKAISDALK